MVSYPSQEEHVVSKAQYEQVLEREKIALEQASRARQSVAELTARLQAAESNLAGMTDRAGNEFERAEAAEARADNEPEFVGRSPVDKFVRGIDPVYMLALEALLDCVLRQPAEGMTEKWLEYVYDYANVAKAAKGGER